MVGLLVELQSDFLRMNRMHISGVDCVVMECGNGVCGRGVCGDGVRSGVESRRLRAFLHYGDRIVMIITWMMSLRMRVRLEAASARLLMSLAFPFTRCSVKITRCRAINGIK